MKELGRERVSIEEMGRDGDSKQERSGISQDSLFRDFQIQPHSCVPAFFIGIQLIGFTIAVRQQLLERGESGIQKHRNEGGEMHSIFVFPNLRFVPAS